jgi:hypothetical protein
VQGELAAKKAHGGGGCRHLQAVSAGVRRRYPQN